LMEAASAGGSCLFTTYAVLPSALVKKPRSILSRLIFAMLPLAGGLVAFAHNHPGMLSINLPSIVPHPFAYKLTTGRKMNIGSFTRAGERIFNLERLINIRQGLEDADTLPGRLTDELQRDGDPKSRVMLAAMLKKYYKIRGWDKHGIPSARRRKGLGI